MAQRSHGAELSGAAANVVAAATMSTLTENPVAAIMGYCVVSISMTVVNKYVVSGEEWNMNFLFLMVQSAVGAITMITCRELGLIKSLAGFDKQKAWKWFPVSLCLVGMIYTGNMALRYLSVPVYTIFKNLTIIVIAYGEVLWFGASLTPPVIGSFGLMILSSCVAAWADIQYALSRDKEESESMATLTQGFVWMMLNVFTSAAYALSIRKFTKLTDFTNWDIMFYNNLLIIPVVAFATLSLEDWSSKNLANNFPPETRSNLLMGMIYSGLGALALTYCMAWVVRTTSSTTYAMVGALNKLPLAIFGIIFFASPITLGGVVAIALGFVSGLVYAWAKISKAPPPKPVQESEIPLAKMPSERTSSESDAERSERRGS